METDKHLKILITGSNGQLGSEIKKIAPDHSNFNFIFSERNDFSLENEDDILYFLNFKKPDIIVNCAAFTAVDKAESERESANAINHLAVATISKWCFQNNCRLIHISTDYVFDGNSEIPLLESDVTNPINFYGESKLLGENACLKNNLNSIIIRTSWVYSEFGNNFVKTMLRLMSEKSAINVVNDQIGSPTYAADLAQTILTIIESGKWTAGIYNFSNEGAISWYDFAVAIKNISKSNCTVNGIPSSEFPTPAKRPNYSLLNKNKIKTTFNITIPDYETSLIVCLNRLLC